MGTNSFTFLLLGDTVFVPLNWMVSVSIFINRMCQECCGASFQAQDLRLAISTFSV